MELKVTLTLAQIYQVLCPKCKEHLADLASRNADSKQIKQNLVQQWETEKDK